jgi:hypothetical protein
MLRVNSGFSAACGFAGLGRERLMRLVRAVMRQDAELSSPEIVDISYF